MKMEQKEMKAAGGDEMEGKLDANIKVGQNQ